MDLHGALEKHHFFCLQDQEDPRKENVLETPVPVSVALVLSVLCSSCAYPESPG